MARTLYPLPDVINPENTRCVIVQVPDDIGHITAFLGAIYNLTKWYSWDRDEDKRGRLVADVWKGVYDVLNETIWEGCDDLNISEFRQNGCFLEALQGGQWIPIFEVKSDCVHQIVNQGISDGAITTTGNGRGDSRSISEELENSTAITGNLDAVWGGCLELAEYVIETTRLLLDLLQASGDAIQAMQKWLGQLKDRVKKKIKDKNGVDQEIDQDIILGDDGESLYDLPVDQYGNDTSVSPDKIVGFFENMLDIGLAVVRAGLTETFLEEVACELFTILTCLPDQTRNETGTITLTTETLYEWANVLLSQSPLDAIIGAVIVIDNVVGSTEFFSFMNLGDAFRQYRLGTLDPMQTWIQICQNCIPEPEPEPCIELNNTYTSMSVLPTNSKLYTVVAYTGIPAWGGDVSTLTPFEFVPNTSPMIFFGQNVSGRLIMEWTAEGVCNKSIRAKWRRGTANSANCRIFTYTQSDGWVQRGIASVNVGGVANLQYTLQWLNSEDYQWEKVRVIIATAYPRIDMFELY